MASSNQWLKCNDINITLALLKQCVLHMGKNIGYYYMNHLLYNVLLILLQLCCQIFYKYIVGEDVFKYELLYFTCNVLVTVNTIDKLSNILIDKR